MGVEPPTPIDAEHVDEAKERLILARATHLDSLAARLAEPRVRRIILRDLGLIGQGKQVQVANPIYREVIVRVLGDPTEVMMSADPRGFVLADGRLDFRKLLEGFAAFWRQHGEVLERRDYYHEVAPQLVMMGYLHRIVNGGGYIDREYGVGRGRIDLTVRWPYLDENGKRVWQYEAVELKVWRDRRADPIAEGLAQLDDYLDRLGLDQGTLVIFDRRRQAPPPHERTTFDTDRTPSGRGVTLLRA